MMSQFRNKNQIRKRNKLIKIILIIIIFLIVAYFTGYSNLVKIVNYMGQPFWRTENYIQKNIDDNSYILRSKKFLWKENEQLKKENSDLKNSMLDHLVLKSENEELKKILSRVSEEKKLILGNILTKPNSSPYDTIIVDIGKNQSVEIGKKVYAVGDIPIGEIDEVYDKTARIILYSSPGKKTEGLLGESNISVELIGRGGGNFEMLIPKDVDFEIGSLVLLPGSSIEIIAYISEIISVPTDPIKKVLLASPVNIQNVKWIQIEIE